MRVLIMGAVPSVDFEEFPTPGQRLAVAGDNLGNLVIAKGLLATIEYSEVAWSPAIGPRQASEEFDFILIPAANFLMRGADLSLIGAFIAATDLPCAIVGLGAQSNDYDPRIRLRPGTEAFVRIVAERTNRIGVRGTFTAEVLDEMGIDNVEITGCPSFYLANRERLELRPKVPEGESPRLVVNSSRDLLPYTFDPERMRATIRELISEGIRYGADFVPQTELDEIELAERIAGTKTGALPRIVDFFRGVAPDDELRQWLLTHIQVYYDVDEWLKAMQDVDFAVGTRFHGCMMAVQAGAPCFLLCHDTRTTEMAEFFGLPHAGITELEEVKVPELYRAADMTKTQARYDELRPKFMAFLRDNGLEPKLPAESSGAR